MTTIPCPRSDILICTYSLEPGEALPWHTDRLRTEYRDTDETETVTLAPGVTHWNEP